MKKNTKPTAQKRNADRTRADKFTWQDGDIEFVPEPAIKPAAKLSSRITTKAAKPGRGRAAKSS
ncbi:MAG: hypothetical protein K9M98_06925 [Cephaloticoccus sp.]|nr:hypothetical protein [Cephaloticoccus sp.]